MFNQFEKGDLTAANVQLVREESVDASNSLLNSAGKPKDSNIVCGVVRYGSILVDLYVSPAVSSAMRAEVSTLIAQAITSQTFLVAGQAPSGYADNEITTGATKQPIATTKGSGGGDDTIGGSSSDSSFKTTGMYVAVGLLAVLVLALAFMVVLRVVKVPEKKHPWDGIPGWRMEGGMAHRGNYMDPVPPAELLQAMQGSPQQRSQAVDALINTMSSWGEGPTVEAPYQATDRVLARKTSAHSAHSAHYYPGAKDPTVEDYQQNGVLSKPERHPSSTQIYPGVTRTLENPPDSPGSPVDFTMHYPPRPGPAPSKYPAMGT